MSNFISILFDSYHLYHLPQFEPLIYLLSKDNRFDIYHSTSRDIKKEEFTVCSEILKSLPGTYVQAETEFKRAELIKTLNLDIFICGWSRYDLDDFVGKKTLVGMIYHGIGIKPSYWLDNHKRLDFRFVEGEYRIKQLKKNNVRTKLHLTGFIKLDPLFQKDKIKTQDLIKKFELDPSKKTILFAPTFYPSSVEPLGMDIGKYTEKYNLLIKPHLWTYFLNKFGEVDLRPQIKILKALAKNYSHIHLIPKEYYNIIPFYKISDLLLTEASSTIYEMLAYNKPVIVNKFFNLKLSHKIFRKRLYKKRLDRQMEADINKFCYVAEKPIDLPVLFKTVFENDDKKLFIKNGYQEKMLYKLDGKSANRAKELLLAKFT